MKKLLLFLILGLFALLQASNTYSMNKKLTKEQKYILDDISKLNRSDTLLLFNALALRLPSIILADLAAKLWKEDKVKNLLDIAKIYTFANKKRKNFETYLVNANIKPKSKVRDLIDNIVKNNMLTKEGWLSLKTNINPKLGDITRDLKVEAHGLIYEEFVTDNSLMYAQSTANHSDINYINQIVQQAHELMKKLTEQEQKQVRDNLKKTYEEDLKNYRARAAKEIDESTNQKLPAEISKLISEYLILEESREPHIIL